MKKKKSTGNVGDLNKAPSSLVIEETREYIVDTDRVMGGEEVTEREPHYSSVAVWFFILVWASAGMSFLYWLYTQSSFPVPSLVSVGFW
ncbi:MAG: hypothetical protein R3A11_02350 [Bdellovibrionota bacterium]